MPGLPVRFASALARHRHLLLATIVVSTIALPQIVSAFERTSSDGRIVVAQKEDPKKKKGPPPKAAPKQPIQQKQVQPPPKQPIQQKQALPPPKQPIQQKQVQPPPKQPIQQKQALPPPKQPIQQKQALPPPKQPIQQKQALPPPKQPIQQKQALPPPKQPIQQKQALPPPKQPLQQKQALPPPKQPLQQKQVQPTKGAPTQQPKLAPQVFGKPKTPPATKFGNVKEIAGQRKEVKKGNLTVIQEPGNRTIIRQNNRIVVRHDDSARLRRWGNARFEVRGPDRYTIIRRGPYEIINVTDANGHLIRRFRRGPDGREYILIDNRRRFGVGAAAVGVAGIIALGLAMPHITIPRDRYIVHVDQAPPVLLYETLDAPPLVPIERAYSLDEIRDNVELRARVRSVDINTINFETGSWEISPDQIQQLQGLAEAMLKVITENPSTVMMIEGHTDAVGSAEDNASLSDRRAEAVAEALTTNFNIPPENLVTQGYGEQHLRVQTQGPSRENRRVEVRNVTGLMAGADGAPPGGGQPGGPAGGPGGQPPG
jgi:outer membrane protein OmpA-like peptidoglycan-associated protein